MTRPKTLGLQILVRVVVILALQKHIAYCFSNQQEYRRQIIAQEEDFGAFEAVIVQNIKVSLSTFYEWRASTFTSQLEQVKGIQTDLKQTDPERDWGTFKTLHDDRFLVVPSEFVQIRNVKYDGHDDIGLTVVKQGKLMRKEGVFKRAYKTIHCVLTHSSYLHCFPDTGKDSIQGIPEMSVDLTECTLQGMMMNEKVFLKFNIRNQKRLV